MIKTSTYQDNYSFYASSDRDVVISGSNFEGISSDNIILFVGVGVRTDLTVKAIWSGGGVNLKLLKGQSITTPIQITVFYI